MLDFSYGFVYTIRKGTNSMNRYDFIKAYNYLTNTKKGNSVWEDMFGSAMESDSIDNVKDKVSRWWDYRGTNDSRPVYEIFQCYLAMKDCEDTIDRRKKTIEKLNQDIEFYKKVRNGEQVSAEVVLEYLKNNKGILDAVKDTQLLKISLALKDIKDAEDELKEFQRQKEEEKLRIDRLKTKNKLFCKYFEMFQKRLNRFDILGDEQKE